MSKAQFDAFYQKVSADDALREKLMSLRGTPDAVYASIASIAKEEGYDVEVADCETAFTDLQKTKLADAAAEDVVAGGQGGPGDMFASNCTKVCGECCGTFMGTYIGQQ